MLISEKGTLEMWNAKYVCSCGSTNYLLSIQVKTILFLNYEYKFTTQLQLPSNNNHIIIRILNQHKNTWYTVFHGQHKKICLDMLSQLLWLLLYHLFQRPWMTRGSTQLTREACGVTRESWNLLMLDCLGRALSMVIIGRKL